MGKNKLKRGLTVLLVALIAFLESFIFYGCGKTLQKRGKCFLNIRVDENCLSGRVKYVLPPSFYNQNLVFCLFKNHKREDKEDCSDRVSTLKNVENMWKTENYENCDDKENSQNYEENESYMEISEVKSGENIIKPQFSDDNCYCCVDKSQVKKEIELSFSLKIPEKEDEREYFFCYPLLLAENDRENLPEIVDFGNCLLVERLSYDVRLNVKSTEVVACGFSPSGIEYDGERTVYCYRENFASDFAFALSENYNVISKKWGNKSINCYFKGDYDGESAVLVALDALEFLKGKGLLYPYDNFTFCVGRCEENLRSSSAFAMIFEGDFSNNLMFSLGTALGKQLFDHNLYFDDYISGYFNEGISAFLAGEFLSLEKGVGCKQLILSYAENLEKFYRKGMEESGKEFNGVMKRELSTFTSPEYRIVAGYKSLLFFEYISIVAGKKNFFVALKKFYLKNQYRRVDESDFISCFSFKKRKISEIFENVVIKGCSVNLQSLR